MYVNKMDVSEKEKWESPVFQLLQGLFKIRWKYLTFIFILYIVQLYKEDCAIFPRYVGCRL